MSNSTWFKRLLCALLLSIGLCAGAQAQTTPIRALVLYDQPDSGPYAKLGMAYAIMLRNLLGHWNTTVDMKPVQSYTAGQVEQYAVTFYLGSYYDLPIPAAFLNDAYNTTRKVVWFKNNLWQLAWHPGYSGFTAKYGFTFASLRGMDATPTSANPNPGFFDTVTYKTRPLKKYYVYDAATGAINADPDVGVAQIFDTAKAQQLVPMSNSRTGEVIPYVVKGGNFWYFADLPFSYIGPRDRYLVICDMLHDILGVDTPTQQRALVRLEDVSALVNQNSMTVLSNYLKSKSIPFGVATIPYYYDPLGAYNGGVSQTVRMTTTGVLARSLNYAIQNGGKIVLHGYTHQYGNWKNPHTGVSGDDYEFWDIVNNKVLPVDTVAAHRTRIQAGVDELRRGGFTAFAWEPPHYQMSPNAYTAATQVPMNPQKPTNFTTWQRAVYYTATTPNLSPTAANRDFAVGQFFPYVIQRDHYGQRILPENLGNIEYDIREVDPSSNYNYTWQDLKLNAENAKVVRDGFASFFFHPFWLEPEINKPGFQDLQSIINAIEALGYQWVDASTL
ncbi:MAG: DUF2334 domain-containing protein [Variovorax sp.]|jgi:uncharacterized protein YdaL|nr:MAG: DUF2334 domain-containing protein [Variovorax sp.]